MSGNLTRMRWRSVLISRAARDVFCGVPGRVGNWMRGWLWRLLFLKPDGELTRAGEILLADLRDWAGMGRATIFDPDPAVMAYREGKRATVMRIINYLNLDENQVLQLTEVDDGNGF